MILEQFDDTLVKILLLAACVSFGLAFFEDEQLGIGAFGAGSHPFNPDPQRDRWRLAGIGELLCPEMFLC